VEGTGVPRRADISRDMLGMEEVSCGEALRSAVPM